MSSEFKSSYSEFKPRRLALRLTQQEIARLLNRSLMGVCFAERGLRPKGRVVREMAQLLMRLECEQQP